MSLRIVFAGTPPFSERILNDLFNTQHEIVGVYTQPDRPKGRGQKLTASPVKQLAEHHGISVYQPKSLKSSIEQEILKNLRPDVLVVVAYGLILPPPVLAIPKYGCINVHASLLPRWRGAAPIQRAILSGDAETVISIMQMDVGLDTGDVFAKVSTPISPDDTSEILHHRLAILGSNALINTLGALEEGNVSPEKQDDSLATYAHKITKEEATLNWNQSAAALDCQIRAFNPWPVAFTHLKGLNIRIFNAQSLDNHSNQLPGTILQANSHGIDVATGQGILRLLELQLSGGKRLPIRDLLNSKKEFFQTGSQFHS